MRKALKATRNGPDLIGSQRWRERDEDERQTKQTAMITCPSLV
jgi:hypothetical protein